MKTIRNTEIQAKIELIFSISILFCLKLSGHELSGFPKLTSFANLFVLIFITHTYIKQAFLIQVLLLPINRYII